MFVKNLQALTANRFCAAAAEILILINTFFAGYNAGVTEELRAIYMCACELGTATRAVAAVAASST